MGPGLWCFLGMYALEGVGWGVGAIHYMAGRGQVWSCWLLFSAIGYEVLGSQMAIPLCLCIILFQIG